MGSQSDGGGCNPGYSYDFDHEGPGGFSATGIAHYDRVPPWLAAAQPDVVMMHLGTNDMWGGPSSTAPGRCDRRDPGLGHPAHPGRSQPWQYAVLAGGAVLILAALRTGPRAARGPAS